VWCGRERGVVMGRERGARRNGNSEDIMVSGERGKTVEEGTNKE